MRCGFAKWSEKRRKPSGLSLYITSRPQLLIVSVPPSSCNYSRIQSVSRLFIASSAPLSPLITVHMLSGILYLLSSFSSRVPTCFTRIFQNNTDGRQGGREGEGRGRRCSGGCRQGGTTQARGAKHQGGHAILAFSHSLPAHTVTHTLTYAHALIQLLKHSRRARRRRKRRTLPLLPRRLPPRRQHASSRSRRSRTNSRRSRLPPRRL